MKGWSRSAGPNEFNLINEDGKGILSNLLPDGTLSLAVEAGPDSEIRGVALFDAAMTHYAERVKAVEGAWYYGDNLDNANELMMAGTSLKDAVAMTWTGRQAARYGFTVPEFVSTEGDPGQFTNIVVRFHRPEG